MSQPPIAPAPPTQPLPQPQPFPQQGMPPGGLQPPDGPIPVQVIGYGCEVEWDGATLVARGTNKLTHFALAGKGETGDVILPAEDIFNAELKDARRFTNGSLTVTTTNGKGYILHFTKKEAAEFAALAEQLPQGGTRPDIEAAKAKMRSTLASHQTKQLANYLLEGETVERMTGGECDERFGLVVLTDRRLIFFSHTTMSHSSEDFPLDKMSSVLWQSGLVDGSIVVYASGNKADITKVNKEDGKEIVDLIRAHLSAAKDNRAQVVVQGTVPAVPGPDVTEQLRKLGELHAAGILTDAEFSAKKAELLDRL